MAEKNSPNGGPEVRRRLPPLNAVRAFEAAARHLSFQKAGEELAVTSGAIAQHVKALEAWLGILLFRRLPAKGVLLTDAGQRYAATARVLLDGFADATSRLRSEENTDHVLTVSTVPSFAARWLTPRLGSFRQIHPEIDVRVLISQTRTDFGREDVDVVIRLGEGVYPGMRSELVMREFFFPVCSPALLNDPSRPLREPADLKHHTLLHEEPHLGVPAYIYWPQWLTRTGVHDVDPTRGPRFPHTFLALQAAVFGQGVALGTNVAIGDDIVTGRLVRPFAPDHDLRGKYSYWLVCPEATADTRKIAAFRAWTFTEAAATVAIPDERRQPG